MVKEKTQKAKKEKAPKPKYNMAQNSWFMIKLAWTSGEKKVIVLSLLSALTAVALNLINLYVSPTILSVVERKASVTELILTIVVFVAALMLVSAASSYVNTNTLYGRISVRCEIIALLNKKAATTSYPNIYDEKFKKLKTKAQETIGSNRAATEAIWTTLTDLTTNIIGFVFYVILMSSIQPLLLVAILVTTVISYFVSKHLNEWGFRHREEESEYATQIYYLDRRSSDLALAKDIRIFGLRSWIDELYAKSMAAYTAFQKKAQGVYIWARIVDLVLTFLRNAIAYAYLIGLVINDGLSVSEFLLFFSAVGGFTAWVSGVLGGFNTLHKQSLDISAVRECLEYPEPFKFEDGEPIEAETNRLYEIKLENVSYRYPSADKDTLTNINLTLHPGEKLAVVGLNGAGKTTLIKLICGFLDPTEGRVLLDGQDIRDFNRRDYYKMFSAVFQEFSLLAGTIATNVAQDSVGIDMERVVDCVEKAGLRKKIESLKDGYETYLNREVFEDAMLLSGGETQRLMLARALYKNAPFIVLDEPTAGTLTILNNPLVVVGIIVVMLAVTFIAPLFSNKAGSYYAKHADDHNLGNRLFSFFGWLGYYSNLATDVRMYRQDNLCDRYNRNKEDTFGSNGLFAHYAWGPIGLYGAAGAAVSVIFTGVVYAFVCLKALAGAFGIGSVTQYVAAITKVSSGMSTLVEMLGFMRNNSPFLKLTFDFLDIPDNMYQGTLTVEKRRDRKYQVEFRNVSFKYHGSENYILLSGYVSSSTIGFRYIPVMTMPSWGLSSSGQSSGNSSRKSKGGGLITSMPFSSASRSSFTSRRPSSR